MRLIRYFLKVSSFTLSCWWLSRCVVVKNGRKSSTTSEGVTIFAPIIFTAPGWSPNRTSCAYNFYVSLVPGAYFRLRSDTLERIDLVGSGMWISFDPVAWCRKLKLFRCQGRGRGQRCGNGVRPWYPGTHDDWLESWRVLLLYISMFPVHYCGTIFLWNVSSRWLRCWISTRQTYGEVEKFGGREDDRVNVDRSITLHHCRCGFRIKYNNIVARFRGLACSALLASLLAPFFLV
jgi:hypothetical protein